MGPLGLIAFIWIWVSFFRQTFFIYRKVSTSTEEEKFGGIRKAILGGCMGAVVCFLTGCTVHNLFIDGEVVYMLMFVVGISHSLENITDRS
jgi:hypothetical protein